MMMDDASNDGNNNDNNGSNFVNAAGSTINKAIDGLFGLLTTVATAANEPLPADDLGIIYITKRLIMMDYPSNVPNHLGTPIDNIAHYFKCKMPGRYMIVNLSENVYDYGKFDDQVLEFKFPGYPAPPLETLFAMCNSIDHWLKADRKNVVAIHCQSGRGRSVCTMAAYMMWCGQLDRVDATIEYIGLKMKQPARSLLIPTQTRYLTYVEQMKSGRRPSSRVLRMQRVIMNGIPRWEDDGCTPYLQVFHKAKLLYTSTGREEKSAKLRSYTVDDNSVLFPLDIEIEGDVLIRIRHISPKTTKRSSMLRFGFHVGYMRPGMHRFQLNEIDGACNNDKFPDDFHVDVIVDSAEDTLGNTRKTDRDRSFWESVSNRTDTPSGSESGGMDGRAEFRLFDEEGDGDNDNGVDEHALLSLSPKVAPTVANESVEERTFGDLDAYVLGLDESNALESVEVDSDTAEQMMEQFSNDQQVSNPDDGLQQQQHDESQTTTKTLVDGPPPPVTTAQPEEAAAPTPTTANTNSTQLTEEDEDDILASLLADDDDMDGVTVDDTCELDTDLADLEAALFSES